MLKVFLFSLLCNIAFCDEDREWVNCKPRKGCSFPRCDPSPGSFFDNSGSNEYPIQCQANTELPSAVSELKKSYDELREENTKLKKDFEEMKLEMSKIQNKLKGQDGDKQLEETKDPSKNMSEIQNKLEGQEGDKQQEKTKDLSKSSCDVVFGETCYWTHVQRASNLNFRQATEICQNNQSIPAYFHSREAYKSIVEQLRSKIPSGWSWIEVWTGLAIDEKTGRASSPIGNPYVKWHTNYSGGEGRSHISIRINSKKDTDHGMLTLSGDWILNGIVCQKVAQ